MIVLNQFEGKEIKTAKKVYTRGKSVVSMKVYLYILEMMIKKGLKIGLRRSKRYEQQLKNDIKVKGNMRPKKKLGTLEN